jgi:hypothetical protein
MEAPAGKPYGGGYRISAAEPSGLWGLLKESFASSTELAKAKMDPGIDALIKAGRHRFR